MQNAVISKKRIYFVFSQEFKENIQVKQFINYLNREVVPKSTLKKTYDSDTGTLYYYTEPQLYTLDFEMEKR